MGLLRQKQSHGQIPFYTGLQIQTSGNNVPISIVWGANKIAPNAIWTGGFYGYYGYPEGSHGGGKGGIKKIFGGGSDSNTPAKAWQYYTSWEMGLCEGPIYGFGTIWQGGTATTFWGADIWGAFTGTQTQQPWSQLYAFGGQALSYHGLAYITSFNYYLGSSPHLPQFSLEVFGVLFNSAGINGGDADPALITNDFLTNSQYGVGFPAGSIDATTLFSPGSGPDSSYQGYCRASYLALSPALTNQEAANSILSRWLHLTNTAAVWSGGKLKFVPYGDSVAGPTPNQFAPGGYVTFTPNVTPVYNLTDDDFVYEEGKDPVEVTRSDPYASYNWQRLQINLRVNSLLPTNLTQPWTYWINGNSYIPLPVDVWDQNAIELYGLRMAPDITANEICDAYVGSIAAQLILQRNLYIRNHYKFKLSFEYCLLEPMDLVTITDDLLGLSNVAVRITEIEEDDSGLLDITAEEFPGGIASAIKYPVQGSGGNSVDLNAVPARVNEPIIFEPSASLTGGIASIFIAASGGVAQAYTLAETGATGQHYVSHVYQDSLSYLPAASPPRVATVTFSIYVQALIRSAVRLNVHNGVSQVGADFDLGAPAPFASADSGVTAAITQAAPGSVWYQLTVTTDMADAAAPIVYVYLETKTGTVFNISYSGTIGDGLYIWGQQFSWAYSDGSGSKPPSFLPAFGPGVNASVSPNGALTPEGTAAVFDPNWGGATVWLSTDGDTYNIAGQILGASRQGFLTASLPAPSGEPDTVNTLGVDLVESGGVLSSGTALDAQSGITLCLVDNELLSYVTATLVSSNVYDLTTLYRGQYGTTAAAHSSGAPFVRVDGSVFQVALQESFIGVPIYVKLQSFNVFGQAVEDLSECTVYTYTPTGAGLPVGPATQTLLLGQNLDYGLASSPASEADNWGIASDGNVAASVDLGIG